MIPIRRSQWDADRQTADEHLGGHSEMVHTELLRRDASADSDHGRALAELWGGQLRRVIARVFEIAREAGRAAWHIDSRTEAIFEMAKLLLWLTERVVTHRLTGRTLAQIDITTEEAGLNSPEGVERVENTARMVAEIIWSRIYDELHRKYPLIQGPGNGPNRLRLPGRVPRDQPPRTAQNHFVAKFTIRPWADAEGYVRELRFRNGTIRFRERPFGRWGFEHFLYPQSLEEYFQRVESRAAGPYKNVLRCLPLTPEDRYFFISLLILQHIRTPSFMATIAGGLRRQVIAKGWTYPVTPEAMRRAYLTLFQQDELFAAYYRRLDGHRWRLLIPAAPMSFPRTDVPIVLRGGLTGGGWSAYYPLSPDRCLQIGPELALPTDVPFALTHSLDEDNTAALNRLLLSRARRSAVVRTADDLNVWSAVASGLARPRATEDYRAWGSLTLGLHA